MQLAIFQYHLQSKRPASSSGATLLGGLGMTAEKQLPAAAVHTANTNDRSKKRCTLPQIPQTYVRESVSKHAEEKSKTKLHQQVSQLNFRPIVPQWFA